jgi:hypothetical protein
MEAVDADVKARVAGVFHVHLTEGVDSDGDPTNEESGKYFSPPDMRNILRAGWLAWLGHTDSGKIFEIDGRTKESLLATTGERKFSWDFVPNQPRELFLLEAIFKGGPPPILARGTEIYGGYAVEEKEQSKEAA